VFVFNPRGSKNIEEPDVRGLIAWPSAIYGASERERDSASRLIDRVIKIRTIGACARAQYRRCKQRCA